MSAVQLKAQLDDAQAELSRHEESQRLLRTSGKDLDLYTRTRVDVLRRRIENLQRRLRIRVVAAAG